ncbi:exodeoxyribonuclease V subunit alpha [Nocardioides sp. Kera G14]|uniref:exodeoxyribonuclease V subunit alpha n=1 Tax=Nocardioides sp. Kera G14 TaxID=2884264 RepID=UPI001D0FF80D|nr:exodeoxyribonuclease V subunit alpha [Nocardioides sp. Kera G14]UDY23307.1 exodeoxyribonuclease V subunit alpha [Nocardioides sp. Kera G14]
MIETWEPVDAFDARYARGTVGALRVFNEAGVLTAADVHVAARLGELVREPSDQARLALALAVRAARQGSVCVDLAALMAEAPELPWPVASGEEWLELCRGSKLAEQVLRFEDGLLYLDRYHREEGQIRDDLLARLSAPVREVDAAQLEASAARIFPGEGYADQRAAALSAARQSTTVLTGGPGTGKTTTVRGLLELLEEQAAAPLRIALTAPTGKAAARLQESVGRTDLVASTLHRLLGWRPGSSTRFRHHRGNTLPHDVIIVDETSMVSLTMMARLLEAVRPSARLVLVGDADQLASVEAGAVLADLVEGLRSRAPEAVAALRTSKRFGAEIGALASALRAGDADTALELLGSGSAALSLIDPEDAVAMGVLQARLTAHAVGLHEAGARGDVAGALTLADEHRLLCAHRDGPAGAAFWNRRIERALADALGLVHLPEWYPGRPILVTANDYGLELFNGDTGVVVSSSTGSKLEVAMSGAHPSTYAPSRLAEVETLHAMTVHKSQGSQARAVTVLLPPADSPLLTRELFYTAVTRAQERVTVVGSTDSVRAAIERRAQRATGLVQRLR